MVFGGFYQRLLIESYFFIFVDNPNKFDFPLAAQNINGAFKWAIFICKFCIHNFSLGGVKMIFKVEVMGVFATNSYFYIDEETNSGFLIDPGAQADKLLRIIDQRKFNIEKILLTHGHFDHISAAPEIQRALNIPICMQKNGYLYAKNPAWSHAKITLENVTYLEDDSEIILAANPDFKLKIIPVAGHTADGAMYYSAKDNVAFVADSIFKGSYGRTDLEGGDEIALFKNIKEKILTLPEETILLSGHTPPTTVRIEKYRPWYNH